MAANELDAAGFVEGSGFKRSPAGSAIAMLPNRYLDFVRADRQALKAFRTGSAAEIMGLIEIGEQSRLFWLPTQRRPGPRARTWDVHPGEPCEPAEMPGRLFG